MASAMCHMNISGTGVQDPITGATGKTYIVHQADNGHRLKVRVTFTDDLCNLQALDSALTAVVGGVGASVTPVVTITRNSSSVTEGTDATFTVRATPSPATSITVDVYISEVGNVLDGAPGRRSVTINGTGQAPLEVETHDDNVDEDAGVVTAEVLDGTGYSPGNPSEASITVNDNDGPPQVTIADQSVLERAGSMAFTVTLEPASAKTVTVNYATSNGTAREPGDYTQTNGTLTFSPNQTSHTISVLILNDNIDEEDETFTVRLSNASNATIGDNAATGTIEDDDNLPSLSIGNASLEEDNADLVFTVELSDASAKTVTVNYATSNGTDTGAATAGEDYTAVTNRSITFSPGDRSKTVSVRIREDNIDEGNENFTVTLSNASNATMGRDEATGTITDDDTRGVRVDPTALNVPENGNNTYTVVLTSQPTENVTVTVGGATGDVSVIGSPLIFTTSSWRNPKTVRVNAADDTDSNSDPPVDLTHTVSGGDYTGEAAASVRVTIVENDISTLSIDNASASESAGTMSFTVRLSVASATAVTVNYTTANGTATAGEDYTAVTNGSVMFAANSTTPQDDPCGNHRRRYR